MIESRELISATRQLGSMTEAGVDILRAIKVIRAQTQNTELIALYDRLAQELRLGSGLPDAMSHAPEAFSAFAVSLVRQGEARGDLATSFYRIADYLQKEREVDASQAENTPNTIVDLPRAALEQCPSWLRNAVYKSLMSLAILSSGLVIVEFLVVLGIITPRWHLLSSAVVILLFLIVMARRLRDLGDDNGLVVETEGLTRRTVKKSISVDPEESTFDKTSEATFE